MEDQRVLILRIDGNRIREVAVPLGRIDTWAVCAGDCKAVLRSVSPEIVFVSVPSVATPVSERCRLSDNTYGKLAVR